MSEKSNELKCTLAGCVTPVEVHESFERLPLHVTIAPPFFVEEKRFDNLVSEYYDTISPWSSLLYNEGQATIVQASGETIIFGTDKHPVSVRLVGLESTVERADFLTLREWLRERTEEVCGQESTKDWILGELHISEGENDLTVLEERIAVDSLILFAKRGAKWRAEEKFIWND